MAITVGTPQVEKEPTVVTSHTFTVPSGGDAPSSGDFLVAFICISNNVSSDEFADNVTGWTYRGENTAIGTDATVAVFTRTSDGNEGGNSYEATNTTASRSVNHVFVLSGVDTSDPVNVFGSNVTGSGTSHPINSVTTDADNCLVMAALSFDGGDGFPFTVATANGFTEEATDQQGTTSGGASNWIGSKTVTTQGASLTVTLTSSADRGSGAVQIAFNPAADAAGSIYYTVPGLSVTQA